MKLRDYKRQLILIVSMVVTVMISAAPLSTNAQSFPAGFSRTLITTGISQPVNMAFAPDGRIFVCEQTGKLRVIKNGALLSTPFITLSVDVNGERGLLGVALDPNFATNKWVYLLYTRAGALNNRIIRVQANGDVAALSTMQTLLDLDPLVPNLIHGIAGTIKFGPDGKLYVASGYNQRDAKSQSLGTYLGKLLRLNPDGSVPSDNPYPNAGAPKNRIWVYGLKNPYTFDIERSTGKIFVNDVGEHTWEEIDDATTAKRNFGWPDAEGNSSNSKYTNPVYEYGHTGSATSTGCAISGGAFLPANSNYPAQYKNNYYFMDVCGAWLKRVTYNNGVTSNVFATNLGTSGSYSCIALTAGPDGNLYYLSRQTGGLYKITYSSAVIAQSTNTTAEIQSQAADQTRKIRLYPSPARTSVTVELNGVKSADNLIKIFDERGTLVKSLRIAGTKTTINTSVLVNGLYYIIINDGSTVLKEKFEINH
jgi:glucose/arabinose dehydrogenase